MIDILNRVNTNNILDILPFLYNREYTYPGGKLMLLENNNIASSWYVYKFKFDASALTVYKESTITMNKGFTPNQYFDRYYTEKCNLVNPENNVTELDVIKTLMVTEYSLNLNDKYLRRMLHEMVSYYNEYVYLYIFYMIYIIYSFQFKGNLLN